MRSFFISILCLLMLIGTWVTYSNYSDENIYNFIDTIEYSILIDVEAGNWDQATSKFEKFEDDWHSYKKLASYFFSTDKINDVEYSLARTKYYLQSKEYSNTSGELSCLKEQLRLLHENELLTLQNLL